MSRRAPRSRNTAKVTRLLTCFLAVSALVLGTVVPATAASAATTAVPASASTGRISGDPVTAGIAKSTLAGFNAGYIISDAVFTNKSTMTEAQIQSFFNSKVSRCLGGRDENNEPIVCLKDFRMNTVSRPGDQYCSGYSGAANESAARIIYRVAQACNINPQVLIVMLQKEQGLITHTWPSAWRYRIALGQGCPDTAPCDPNFIGFFHQIYGAARQMQIYMEGKWFQWYAPGRTWNILYNPNRSCGSSPVYVANKATSALYYYTPYQPNAAALRAGYGTGDGCSAYGNRNFYNYFTDWFGSTQNPTSMQGLVKVGTAVWLLSGTNRYHLTAEAYPEYKAVFGAPVVVTQSVLDKFKEGPRGSFYVRNASTGVVAFLSGNQTHRFPSCALVETWGGACGASLVQLTPALFTKFQAGAEMSAFGRWDAGGRIHQVDGGTAYPVFGDAAARSLNGGKTPFAAVFPSAVKSKLRVADRTRFGAGLFIREKGDSRVWLADAQSGVLYHLPSWATARELGLAAVTTSVVSRADLANYREGSPLGLIYTCGGKNYLLGEGKLRQYVGTPPAGFGVTGLDAANCSALQLSGGNANKGVFLRIPGGAEVYHAVDGKVRHIATVNQMIDLNGGIRPTVNQVSKDYFATLPQASRYPAPGTVMRAQGASEVWFVDGARLLRLPSWSLGNELGYTSPAAVLPGDATHGMERRGDLQPFVRCADGLYVIAGGRKVAVAASDVGEVKASDLSPSACAALASGATVSGRLFLSDGTRTLVYTDGGFLLLRDQAAVNRAAGGVPVTPVSVSASYLSWLPSPTGVPQAGDAVRADGQSEVTLVDGTRRLHVPNWGVGEDLGIREGYRVVSAPLLANLPLDSTRVGIFVLCEGRTYVAARGVLYPLAQAALGGFVPVSLTAETCRTMRFAEAAPITSLRLTQGNGVFYEPVGGKLVSSSATTGTVLTVDARTIAGMPK